MTKKMLGTCSWCFKPFVATEDGITQRHGWQEAGGVRRIGEYGNVYHSGNCGGMDYPPYELSAKGTKAYKKLLKEWLAGVEKNLTHLATRPAVVAEAEAPCGKGRSYETLWAEYAVRLESGEEEVEVFYGHEDTYRSRTFGYKRVLKMRVAKVKAEKNELKKLFAFMTAKIESWKLAKMGAYETKKQTVHYKAYRSTMCGNIKSYGLGITKDESEVTCSRCLAGLESLAKEKAAKEADVENGKTLHAWLLKNGPSTGKVCKTALGWDQKTFNRAIERINYSGKTTDDRIGDDWGKPKKYKAIRGRAA